MKNKIPQTKEEAFAQLDALLSEEDKNAIVEDKVFDFHFSLGLWIRNNWIYPMSHEEIQSLMKLFVEEEKVSPFGFISIHPDETKTIISEKYIQYLTNKK